MPRDFFLTNYRFPNRDLQAPNATLRILQKTSCPQRQTIRVLQLCLRGLIYPASPSKTAYFIMAATPTYHLTQFTPSPSCGIGSDLWAVSKTCLMTGGLGSPTTTVVAGPLPWVSCTAVQMGEPPDKGNFDCYVGYRSTIRDGDGDPTYFSACPVGYDTASIATYYPFYRTTTTYQPTDGRDPRVPATDVVASIIYCCPTASGFGFHITSERLEPFTTVHDGTTYRGDTALMPMCVATSVKALSSAQTVTLTPYSDTRGWEKRQEKTADALSTAAWDPKAKVWAEAESFYNTVFGDGHTCYDYGEAWGEGPCTEYWAEHYTSPDVLPTPSTPNQGSPTPNTMSQGLPTPSTTNQGGTNITNSGSRTRAGAATSTISINGGGISGTQVKGSLFGFAVLILALGAVVY